MFKDLQAFYVARHEPESMHPLAEVYWRALLSVGLVMVVGVLVYGTWEFFEVINNLGSADQAGPPRSASLDRNQLKATLEALQERSAQFDALHTAVVADPSR